MIVCLVFLFVFGLCATAAEANLQSQEINEVLPSEIRGEFDKLSRYCGQYNGYSGYNNYYRPTNTGSSTSGLNLASLIQPAVFGLATGGGLAALAGLLGK